MGEPDLYVASTCLLCGDAEVGYRNWGDCSYVGTVYVVMLKGVIGIGGTDM